MLMGSEFQICGAEILKPRDPNDKLYRVITVMLIIVISWQMKAQGPGLTLTLYQS